MAGAGRHSEVIRARGRQRRIEQINGELGSLATLVVIEFNTRQERVTPRSGSLEGTEQSDVADFVIRNSQHTRRRVLQQDDAAEVVPERTRGEAAGIALLNEESVQVVPHPPQPRTF